MTAKQLKFLQLFSELSKVQVLEPDTLTKRISPIMDLDYGYGVDVWEYMTTIYESQLSKSKNLSEYFGETLLNEFAKKSEQKTIMVIRATAAIRRFVYQYNPKCDDGLAYRILNDFVNSAKFDIAEEILRCMLKNPHIDFFAVLKDVIERQIVELLKKSTAAGKKLQMSRKLQAFLLSFTSKLKASDRSLLEQRLREVN